MPKGPLVRVPFVPCEYTARCNHHAYARVSLGGAQRKLKEPVNTCRTHVREVIDLFRDIAPNNILLRGTEK